MTIKLPITVRQPDTHRDDYSNRRFVAEGIPNHRPGTLTCEVRYIGDSTANNGIALDNHIMPLIHQASAMRDVLQELLDWAREHTSPSDANSPHAILVRAHDVLTATKREG